MLAVREGATGAPTHSPCATETGMQEVRAAKTFGSWVVREQRAHSSLGRETVARLGLRPSVSIPDVAEIWTDTDGRSASVSIPVVAEIWTDIAPRSSREEDRL
jgi:hypothetical protein